MLTECSGKVCVGGACFEVRQRWVRVRASSHLYLNDIFFLICSFKCTGERQQPLQDLGAPWQCRSSQPHPTRSYFKADPSWSLSTSEWGSAARGLQSPAYWWPSTSHGVTFSFFLSSKIVLLRVQHPLSQGHPSFLVTPNTLPRPKWTSQHWCPCFYEEATSHAPPDLRGFLGTVLIPKAMGLFFPVAEPPLLHLSCIEIPSFSDVHPSAPPLSNLNPFCAQGRTSLSLLLLQNMALL